MKFLVVLCAIALVLAAASPVPASLQSDGVQLLKYENNNLEHNSYKFEFEQSDGNKQVQQGEIKNEGREDETLVVRGSFSWIAPNGIRYTVTYVADEGGYQPEIEEGPGGVPPGALASLLG